MQRWQYWGLVGGGALAAAALLGAGANAVAGAWHPATDSFRFQGIDVSAAEGPFDWPVVREQGVDFVYLDAVRGDAAVPGFEGGWQALAAASLGRGAILHFSLCRLAVDQANRFNTLVPRARDALAPVLALDFDPACPARPDRAVVLGELNRLIAMIEAHSGKPAVLKIAPQFEATYRVSTAIDRPLWAVQDFFPPDYAARPWRLWQATRFRRIDGAPRAVRWSVVAP